jgi:acetylornithine deacetylase/succinyl-diaminopimelate desuccinylase-like protein
MITIMQKYQSYEEIIKDVHTYLEENKKTRLDTLLELIRHKSISATGEGVEECCTWIQKRMEELHLSVTRYPVKPYPVLIGRFGNNPAKKTILVYAHYDVKPIGDLSKWRTEPFTPIMQNGKIYARGSADNKSPLMAHLEALRYYQKRGLDVPVNLIFLFEGCEEDGSKGLPDFLIAHKEELQADLVFFSDGPKDPCGLPIIALGAKGDLAVCLKVKTMNRNVHARYASVLPSAAWQLIEILHQFKQGDKVLIPGFYEGIQPLTETEQNVMQNLPPSENQLNTIYEAKTSHYGAEFYIRLLSSPTFNICSIRTGANGIIPAEAEANIDIRLVPGQHPDDILTKMQDYLKVLGYDNATLEKSSSIEPSKTPIDTPWLPIVAKVTKHIYGQYVIYPCRPSSAPDYLWTNILKLPAIQVRWSDADSDNHAPNEHISVQEYLNGIALTAGIFTAIAAVK